MALHTRDQRAVAQAMLWSPLHPDPDGLSLSLSDRKVVIGVYPIRVISSTSGSRVGDRDRVRDYRPDGLARLIGRYFPRIDE